MINFNPNCGERIFFFFFGIFRSREKKDFVQDVGVKVM